MKNADMPAMPLINNNGSPVHYSSAGMENTGVMFGMTKREEFAKAALQGLLAAQDAGKMPPHLLVEAAIAYADMTLEALDSVENASVIP